MSPAPAYRQPWFWAIIVAVAAIFIFAVVIAASNANRADRADSTTIVQQPAPPPADTETSPTVIGTTPSMTEPAYTTPSTPPASTTPPVTPERPERPAPAPKAPPQVIRERTVIIREPSQPAPEVSVTPGTFRDTELPNNLEFNDTRFQASGTTRIQNPDAELKSAGTAEDSTLLFVSPNATEPYQSVLVLIPDKPGEYVVYKRR